MDKRRMRKSEDLHIHRNVGECLERNDKLAFRKRQSYLQSAEIFFWCAENLPKMQKGQLFNEKPSLMLVQWKRSGMETVERQ
jgi:hypothetical protein